MLLKLSTLAAMFPLNGAAVLIVDDAIENTQQLHILLRAVGCEVHCANSAEQARQILSERTPDVILLDIMMPEQDGLSFCEELKRDPRLEEVSVIFISGLSELTDKVMAFGVGGADFVTKPFEPTEVLARLSHHFRMHRMRRALLEEREQLLLLNQRLSRSRQETVEVMEVLAEQLQGKIIDKKYRLEELIGMGGSAMVYRATQLLLKRSVAVKILRPSMGGKDRKSSDRFQSETQLAARIQHPNVAALLDAGVSTDGLRYLVMELLRGSPLSEQLRNGTPFSLSRSLEIMIPICSAIKHAHRIGILHRDVKPSNIFLHQDERGEIPKLLDFGIALAISSEDDDRDDARPALHGTRRTGSDVVGTLCYMSPEQMEGRSCDGRSDVYSFAVTLYEMLTGRLPFAAQGNETLRELHQKMQQPALPPSSIQPSIPKSLDALFLQMLSPIPNERPRAAELLVLLIDQAVHALTPSAFERLRVQCAA